MLFRDSAANLSLREKGDVPDLRLCRGDRLLTPVRQHKLRCEMYGRNDECQVTLGRKANVHHQCFHALSQGEEALVESDGKVMRL